MILWTVRTRYAHLASDICLADNIEKIHEVIDCAWSRGDKRLSKRVHVRG